MIVTSHLFISAHAVMCLFFCLQELGESLQIKWFICGLTEIHVNVPIELKRGGNLSINILIKVLNVNYTDGNI